MSQADYRERTTCRLCGGGLTRVLDLPRTPLANELTKRPDPEQDTFPLYLARCVDCTHVQLPVVVNPVRLFRNYVYQSSTSPVFFRHLEDFARDVKPVRSGGFVFEIGSNDGTLLSQYKALGYHVLGCDPAKNIADIAEELGVPTLHQFFGRHTLANWSFHNRKPDLILALNVFAHADGLGEIAECVSELLADDGQFVIECGYLPDMISHGVFRVVYHEHLSYWHIGPMFSFLKAHGLHLYDAHRVPTQGGSMRYFASKETRRPTDRLRALLDSETPESCDVSRLAKRIETDKSELRELLDEAHAAGKTVCGYGAPAQLTTTAYAIGLKRDDVAFIVDDNPLKQCMYTPGLGWPIVPTSALIDKKPDVCVLFSANFATDIINRHPDFEGEWVLP